MATTFDVCFAPILLKKSKIARLRKSREGQFFVVSVAASLCRTSTRTYDRFSVNRFVPSHRRVGRTSGAGKFRSSAKKDFFNSIRQERPLADRAMRFAVRPHIAPQ
jgi:hypothetical protein